MPDFLLTTLAVCIGLSSLLNHLKDGVSVCIIAGDVLSKTCCKLFKYTEGVASKKKNHENYNMLFQITRSLYL